MHHLLKQAQLFLAHATDNIEAVKTQKRQEIQKHINNLGGFKKLREYIENYYSFIKDDPTLLHNIAQEIAAHEDFHPRIKQDKKELANAIFEIMLNRGYSAYKITDTLQLWAPFIDHKFIRQFEQHLINLLAKYIKENKSQEAVSISEDGSINQIIQYITRLTRDPKTAPYVDVAALERIISSINPTKLPAFDNNKRQLKTTDILKLLVSERGTPPLTMEKLKSIFVRSSPQAQQILRSVLWQALTGRNTKFMLDESGSTMDVNMKPAGIAMHDRVIPADPNYAWVHESDLEEREKWLEIFNDYKLAPFIQF